MRDESSVVLKWAQIIRDHADAALNELEGAGYDSAASASVQVAQIKGVCSGIIAAVDRDEEPGGVLQDAGNQWP